jgi:hypothetical protein
MRLTAIDNKPHEPLKLGALNIRCYSKYQEKASVIYC